MSQDDAAPPRIDVSRLLTRSVRTILFADIVESVHLIELDEEGTIHRWSAFVDALQRDELPARNGRLIKSLGDGVMLEFTSPLAAVQTALAMHERIAALNVGRPDELALWLRVGVHTSDVLVSDLDVFGVGVNLAARLTGLAGRGEVVVSAAVRDSLVEGVDAEIEDLGDNFLKNVASPMRAYRVGPVRPSAHGPPGRGAPPPIEASIAVLPFAGRDAGDDTDAIGDLVADRVIAELSRIGSLRVVSRLSTAAFRDRIVPTAEVGEHLRSTYVLSGSYRCRGSQVMVTTELADSRTSNVMWAEGFDEKLDDLFQADSGLARRIAAEVVRAVMDHEVNRARTQPLPTLESYALLLAAIGLMHRFGVEDFEYARKILDHLGDRMPRLAQPHAWLARWHLFRVLQGWSADVQQDRQRAREYAHRALDRDPNSAMALTIAGSIEASLARDLVQAEKYYRSALDINPNEPLANALLGTAFAFQGIGGPAWEFTHKALDLSPLDPMRYFYETHAAGAAVAADRPDYAVTLIEQSLRANRKHVSSYRVLITALVEAGRAEEARAVLPELLRLDPDLTIAGYLERSPTARYPMGKRIAAAMQIAGVPPA